MAAAAAAAESSSSSARSGGGGATADTYIGSLISLTSKSEIRYEGILYNINTEESSIGLRNVRSFGTEGRKKDGPQVPPSDKIYEYILFRGSDIRDLQVKSSPTVQTTPPINSDPAIIQSHYSRPTSSSTSLPTNVSGSLTDLGSQSAQLGHPGSTFQRPLYQPGGNLGSWGPSPPPQNANGSGLAMPMYWQGFYGAPNGLPQLHQQSLLQPPSGLLMPPSMQQMQFSGFNASLPSGPSNLPEYPSPLAPSTTNSFNLTPTPLPASTLPSTVTPMQPMTLASETLHTMVSNKALISGVPTSTLGAPLPSTVPPMQPMTLASATLPTMVSNKAPISSLATSTLGAPLPSISPLTTSGPDVNAVIPPISGKLNAIYGAALSHQTTSQSVTSVAGTFSSVLAEAPILSLVTPGQLLQSGPAAGPAAVSSIHSSQTAQKDVEVVQVSPKPSPEPPAPVRTEAQPPILPLPQSARAQKPNGAPFQTRQNYRGRGGRGPAMSRPVSNFTEEFDFMAMNEKFKKEEVWGSLGKSDRSKDKEGNGSNDDDAHVEDDTELQKAETKSVYNKDDFFDNLSSNALDNDSNRGRVRFSEQLKLDTETFGEFSRYRGGRGGRGPGRGGRSRGGYYGRGYGYGYVGRGRGQGVPNRSS